MDTDSIHFETKTDVYDLLATNKEFAGLFDLSPFPPTFKKEKKYGDENKGKIGTWKVEVCSYIDAISKEEKLDQIVNFECLRAKSYSMQFESSMDDPHIKNKGVKTASANTISHSQISEINKSGVAHSVAQKTFRKSNFEIYTIQTQINDAFSNDDDKRIYDIRQFFII